MQPKVKQSSDRAILGQQARHQTWRVKCDFATGNQISDATATLQSPRGMANRQTLRTIEEVEVLGEWIAFGIFLTLPLDSL
jgi:hypothetical protein